MPLVTRSSVSGRIFKQADEPTDWLNGDLWVDTDTAILSVNNNGTGEEVLDQVLDAPTADHLIANSVGQSIAMMRNTAIAGATASTMFADFPITVPETVKLSNITKSPANTSFTDTSTTVQATMTWLWGTDIPLDITILTFAFEQTTVNSGANLTSSRFKGGGLTGETSELTDVFENTGTTSRRVISQNTSVIGNNTFVPLDEAADTYLSTIKGFVAAGTGQQTSISMFLRGYVPST